MRTGDQLEGVVSTGRLGQILRQVRSWLVHTLLLICALACGREANPEKSSATLTIFAAASLRDAFAEIGTQFEKEHPRARVVFNFAGTQQLRTQLSQGARADLFASADEKHMDALRASGRIETAAIFAENLPVIVTSTEAKEKIRSIEDLKKAQRLVIGTEEVPIGRYSEQILERASAKLGEEFRAAVLERVVSRELNVRQVLHKVSLGEAEAGVVYLSDVNTATNVSIVSIPEEFNITARYPVALLSDAPEPKLARAFYDFVLSQRGAAVLQKFGFRVPGRASTQEGQEDP